MSDEDVWDKLKRLAAGPAGFEVLKGEIHGTYPVPICIKGVHEIDFEPGPATLGPGETLRYWLCISEGRAWYEFEVIPMVGTGPRGLG